MHHWQMHLCRCHVDLGASINVIQVSIYKSLNFGDLEPTGITIQLANRSIVQPLGVLEDVLIQVNELIFPADFYVLDMEDETSGKESTLIMGRPFLMKARTKIDVHVGTLLMEFGDTLVQFNILEAMKHPTEDHSFFGIDVIERRLNLTILDVVKKEVTKLLATGIIYPISDNQWVSPVQVVPKKSGMTVTKNQQDELATRKDHFPLPFIDQVLEKLAGKSHYCFLDGFSGYMQLHIAPEDQHKTTFTYPFGTFAYTYMPCGLCNALSTFQRCMTSIFSDLL
ncbi:hypothetical protein CR513_06157, partial [Mucuna pruriens]